ncbi:Ras-related protein Rab-8A [Elysia marginata]|uniref:Ras-related protein Rab-8A n=1 Tax=Elysia marginata TaxID=1093978 RepID=A0AAV4JW00_9GAST|nr:Ras-related protein Rab-8A [Elysia marginata]
MAKAYDYLFKVILIGDSGTDKVGIMRRFCQPIPYSVSTVGIAFMIQTIELDSKKIKMQLWDTAGSERFHQLAPSYFRGTLGIVVVYDITKRQSFENIVRNYKLQIDRCKSSEAVVLLVGNNCHLNHLRQVSRDEGKQFADQSGFLFFETSSDENINIEQAFVTLAQAIKERVAQRSS